jgi:hypothetical protein
VYAENRGGKQLAGTYVSKRGDLRFLEILSGSPGIEHGDIGTGIRCFCFPKRGEMDACDNKVYAFEAEIKKGPDR